MGFTTQITDGWAFFNFGVPKKFRPTQVIKKNNSHMWACKMGTHFYQWIPLKHDRDLR